MDILQELCIVEYDGPEQSAPSSLEVLLIKRERYCIRTLTTQNLLQSINIARVTSSSPCYSYLAGASSPRFQPTKGATQPQQNSSTTTTRSRIGAWAVISHAMQPSIAVLQSAGEYNKVVHKLQYDTDRRDSHPPC